MKEIKKIKAYGIKSNGEKVLINSDCRDSALRAGQTLELYKADLIAMDQAFFDRIVFE